MTRRPIILCLSGGGLRATFFHLGLVAALRQRGILDDVEQIYSISGGSIAAAHLLKNWDRYNGSEDQFREVSQELLSVGQWDIRGRVVRRYIASYWFFPLKLAYLLRKHPQWIDKIAGGLTEFLERQYARIFGNVTFSDIYSVGSTKKPNLHILATNLTTGELCEFSKHGYTVHRRKGETDRVDVSSLPLSLAVAASSAFPPLFPPVKIDGSRLLADQEQFPHIHRLTDGGVFDNYGVYLPLEEIAASKALQSVVVISDASAPLAWALERRYFGPIGRNSRASSILMDRVGDHVFKRLNDNRSGDHVVVCSLRDASLHQQLLPEEVRMLNNVRTDLDWFDPAVCRKLALRGQFIANKQLASIGVGNDGGPVLVGGSTSKERDISAIVRATVRKVRIASLTDWVSIPATSLALIGFVGLPLLSFSLGKQIEAGLSGCPDIGGNWTGAGLILDANRNYGHGERFSISINQNECKVVGRFPNSDNTFMHRFEGRYSGGKFPIRLERTRANAGIDCVYPKGQIVVATEGQIVFHFFETDGKCTDVPKILDLDAQNSIIARRLSPTK